MARHPRLPGSFWPSERQELLLRAGVLRDERGQAAWDVLRQDLDVPNLETGLGALLPLVYQTLTERKIEESQLPRLKGVYRFIWYRNQVRLEALRGMLDALQAGGVEAIVLGDAALVLRYYRVLGLRPLDELAVLVRPSEVADASAALANAAWTPAPGGSGGHRRWVQPEKQDAELEYGLYWRVLLELDSSRVPSSEESFWRARGEVELGGASASTLSTTHELLRTCVAGARTGGGTLWVADAATILDSAGSDVDWQLLISEASGFRCELRLRDALTYLASALDAPVPQAALDELAAVPGTSRERLAHRLAGRGGRLLGNLPPLLAAQIVASQDESPLRAAAAAPEFLQREWNLDHVGQLPRAVVRRGAAAWSSARAGRFGAA